MINTELNKVVTSKGKVGDVFVNFNSHENILCLKLIMHIQIFAQLFFIVPFMSKIFCNNYKICIL